MSMNFLTPEEFGQRLKLSRATVVRAIKAGKIFAIRPGPGMRSPYRIAESELERLQLQGMCEKRK
jgi:excisionase family DNA binding protein